MRPAEVTRYIALVVKGDPSAELVREWFCCVKQRAPFGIVATVAVTNDAGSSQVALVKRCEGDLTSLIIPLSRDLLEDEANKIIAAFMVKQPDLDCDIEATVVRTGENSTPIPKINIDQERYIELCASLAKKQHEDWVRSRSSEGWRYGQQMSMTDKTHPLLRPWDQLPDRFQTIDMEQPQRMIDLLTQHGYVVVNRDDLDVLFQKVRQPK